MSQAEISVCIIAKNEGNGIEKCLQSIRPFVKQIIIVDTGSTDNTMEIVRRYADIVQPYSACNDSRGEILDFSMARNESIRLASYDTIMWVDADDIVQGMENISKYVEKYKNLDHPHFIQAPYEYSYDDKGNCTLVHYRERIFFKKNAFQFVNPVHEVCIGKPGFNISSENIEDIVWKHQRQYVEKQVKPERNLRILQTWIEKNGEEKDARQLYYIGLEYGNSGNVEKSRYYLEKYLTKSGWADEMYMALLRLITYSLSEAKFDETIDYALRAIKIKPEWAEAYFEAAKACYSLANEGKDELNNWNKCVHFAKIGLSLPPTKTVLFVNPLERDLIIHRYLNFALNKLGRVHEALESVKMALKVEPADSALLGNQAIYEKELAKLSLLEAVSKYKQFEQFSEEEENSIHKAINKEASPMSWAPYHRPVGYPKNVTEKDFPVAAVGPHSQAWVVPESFVYEDLPVRFNHKQLTALTVEMTKQFILHDELTSAILFLENAPTMVRDSDEVESLLRKVKSMTEWTKDEKDFDKWNAPLDSNLEPLKTEMVPLPYPLVGQAGVRLNLMTDRMPDKNKSVMELGAIDGEMTHRVKMMGYKEVVGVDGCESSIKVAIDAGKRNNLDTVLIHSFFDQMDEKLKPYGEDGKFDYVFTSDTVEHLHSPVEQLLVPAFQHLKDDGKFLLTCPHQSLYRGEFRDWVHPWLSAYEPKSLHWLELPRRGHLIAPTVWSMAENVRKAGFFISEAFRFGFPHQDVPDQGQIVIEAYKKFPNNYKNGKDIVFYMGDGLEEVNPHTINMSGIGGSENAVREMSKALALRGHRVRVYAGCGAFGEGIYDGGVEWRLTEKYHDLKCDILVVSREASALDDQFNIQAGLKVLVSHDLHPKGLTEKYMDKANIIFALSEWHKRFMVDTIPWIDANKIVVSGNGIDPELFEQDVEREKYKMLVSSSPDRHLASTLKIFDMVKEKIPEATLSVAYGFFNWRRVAELTNDKNQIALIDNLERELKERSNNGVNYLGRINQKDLAREYLSSSVWCLPSWFQETNCINLSSSQMAGCWSITSTAGALKERNLPEFGDVIEGDWLDIKFQREFADRIISAMKNTTNERRDAAKNYASENLSWAKFAESWDNLFSQKLNSSLENYISQDLVPYAPLYERVS